MNPNFRFLLVAAALATLLAACGVSANPISSDAPSAPAQPGVPPSEAGPSEPEPGEPEPSQSPVQRPSEPAAPSQPGTPVPSGTLTAADGAAADGPGELLSDALAGNLSEPVFVRGVVFRDADGVVWMADSVLDASVPTFSDVRVRVANYPTDGPTWDMADADITGLQEVNGIRFFDETKLYGTITP